MGTNALNDRNRNFREEAVVVAIVGLLESVIYRAAVRLHLFKGQVLAQSGNSAQQD